MFDDWLTQLIQRHHRSGLVIDSNLLLLFVVGQCGTRLISTFKRTRNFTPDDYLKLRSFLGRFSRLITSPGILTEVYNLATQLVETHRKTFALVFRDCLTALEEEYVPSRVSVEHVHFPKCGLTDASIMTIAQRGLLVLTDDMTLTGYLGNLKVDCINFNHIRFGAQ